MRTRLGERIPLRVPAALFTTNGRKLQATVFDISLSGLGLFIRPPMGCPLEPCQRVIVDFEPLGVGTGKFVLEAYVARFAENRVGLMFAEYQNDLMLQLRCFASTPPQRSKSPNRPLRWLRASARFGARSRRAADVPRTETRDYGSAGPQVSRGKRLDR